MQHFAVRRWDPVALRRVFRKGCGAPDFSAAPFVPACICSPLQEHGKSCRPSRTVVRS